MTSCSRRAARAFDALCETMNQLIATATETLLAEDAEEMSARSGEPRRHALRAP